MQKFCYLCDKRQFIVKNKKTRDNSRIKVVQCDVCSLTTLYSFDHLSNVSYIKGDMHQEKINNKQDYDRFLKSLRVDDNRRFKQWSKIIKNKTVLDFGCGAGGFLKLIFPVTKKVYGVELDDITRFYNKKIKVEKQIEDFDIKFDIITLFHVLEHIKDPIELLKKLKKYLNFGGKIIIEVPNDDDALISYYKSQAFKDFTYWSLH